MKTVRAVLCLLPLAISALPSFAPELRDGLPGPLGALVQSVQGVAGSLASSIDPDNKRPEPGYDFREPGPNDSRGPCPGLNLLANYGYLPRDGHVNMGQVIEAVNRGFNMGTDLATVLTVFAIITDGDIATESWYLGSGPNHVGGLNRHSTVEADISPNKEDYYNGCGDNHHISSYRFAQNVQFASESKNKEFDYEAMRKQYVANSKFTQANNPYIYFFPFPSIVSVVAFNFYPEFFSNGTYGAGGVANYESISNIVGAKYDDATGHFQYVPERWPENWYRRATPYGAIEALTDGFTRIYPGNPVGMPIGQLGTDNLNVTTILCDAYQGLNSITPLELSGDTTATQGAISWALGKLTDIGLTDTVLGCPKSVISPNEGFLYPNASQVGGPANPPPSTWENTGNNVYGKTYFCTPPTEPMCSHTC